MADENAILPAGRIEERILVIRGQRVMLDADLAELYGTQTGALVRAVKRNKERFPTDFMFQLGQREYDNLRCQIGTSSQWGGRRYAPYAFTEHGAIMAASVLNSERAVRVSVYVVRAFVKLRQVLAAHKELGRKLAALEGRLDRHDEEIAALLEAIREVMAPPPAPRRGRIGFRP
ncbi:MAG: ORF6N domain-containing protein [Planctomycetes bacterium]|nr:ORF6N domain-containing protein [Planctomycetota bacterium]